MIKITALHSAMMCGLAVPLLSKALYTPSETTNLFRVAAGAELVLLMVCLFRPRLGACGVVCFAMTACLYHVFSGKKSCGCFGALLSASHGRFELLYAAVLGLVAVSLLSAMRGATEAPGD